MIMKYIYITIAFLFGVNHLAHAQYTMFAESGTVTYDKTMYMKNIVRKQYMEKAGEQSRPYFQSMLTQLPENAVLKKELKFTGNETLFGPVKQEIDPKLKQTIMQLVLDMDATTYSNLKTKAFERYNDIVGQKVIVKDTVKNIKWNITDEYREIAGYNCRRANGITPDSVYVIGYYAIEIPIDGGPESINGLPGLILGLVVPSQHISYFATKVELSNAIVIDKKLFENQKIKRMSRIEMDKQFTESLSSFMNKETVSYIMKLALL